jgi:FtsX-like permease family
MGLTRGSLTRGSMTLPRMGAHRLVIVAAVLTTVVAAALAAALATFSGSALPRAARHNLATASGTTLVISGYLNAGQAAQFSSMLPGEVSAALAGTPFAWYHADWSDPLGFVAGSLPAQPASAGNVPIAEAAALSGIQAHAVLVSGRWPGPPRAGQPIPAVLPAASATLLHVTDGDLLRMRDRISGGLLRFRITGLYRPSQLSGASAAYWGLDDIGLSGSTTTSGFTTYGPLTVQAAAFAGPLALSAGSWLAQPAMASIPAGALRTVAANVTGLGQTLASAQTLPDLLLTTGLPSVLDGTASNLDVARSLLAICAVLLFLLAGAALLAMARLLAGQREGESAMLAARGATRWQLARLTVAEAIPLCVIAAVAGGLAGTVLARHFAGTDSLPADFAGAWPAAAVVAAAALVIMVLPAMRTVTPGAARARRGRQAAISGVTRAGADVALVLLAVLACWQLRHYSAVSAGAGGSFGVDPVIAVAPALALAGGTVAALRLLPVAGKAGDRLAARGRRLTAALASWQISRQPIRQGGAALLIVLAVATGTLALAQRQSWTGSDHDQAAFGSGADVRVETIEPLTAAQAGALVQIPGVRHAMPVAAFPQYATNGEVLALDAGQAADVSLLRADQSALPEGKLFATILPGPVGHGGHGIPVTGPAAGYPLPGRAGQVRLTARLGPASLRLAPVAVSLSVQDADGDVYQVPAGTLLADGRDHGLEARLTSRTGSAIYPLRLTAITVAYTLPAIDSRAPAVFAVDSLSGGPGTTPVPGTDLLSWTARASSAELTGVRQSFPGTTGSSGLPAVSPGRTAGGEARSVTFDPGYGLAAGLGTPPSSLYGQLALTAAAPSAAAIPGLATQRFLAASHAGVGSTVLADLNGAVIRVKIVAAITTFPTVSASGGALIVDLATLQGILTSDSLEPAQATQWWLATAGHRTPPGLPASLPPGSAVTSSAATATALVSNQLSAVPQQALLAVAVAAAALGITGFCVSIAAGVRQRRAENALLAALGVARRAAAGQLCLEKLMLSLPSALAGLALGVVLAELLVPAITLTASATTPVPPVIIQVPWSQALALALAVAVLPVLAAALTIARRPDAAAGLRAAEAA